MFFYSIYGYEENVALQHEKKFTKDEFEVMCKEAPLFEDCYSNSKYYLTDNIMDYLKKIMDSKK